MKAPIFTIDESDKSVYIKISDKSVKYTREAAFNPLILIDFDDQDQAVGVEILGLQGDEN